MDMLTGHGYHEDSWIVKFFEAESRELFFTKQNMFYTVSQKTITFLFFE